MRPTLTTGLRHRPKVRITAICSNTRKVSRILFRMKLGETLGAVAALQQQCALGDAAKRRLERSRLIREDQRPDISTRGLLSRGQLQRRRDSVASAA